MTASERADGRGSAPPATAASNYLVTATVAADDTAEPRQPRELRAVPALAFRPAGRRSTWLWLVRRCPFCGYAHAHRGGPVGGVRAAGCGRGEYRLLRSARGWAA